MARTQHSIVVNRPVEEVFAVLMDVTLTGRWFPLEVEEHWTSPPPLGVGSTRRARLKMFGRIQENEAVATAYDAPWLAAMKGTSSNAPFDATLRFAPTEGGTLVDVEIDIRIGGLMAPVGPVFARWYGTKWDQGLANAKRMMESGQLNPKLAGRDRG